MTPPWEDPRVREGLARQFVARKDMLAAGAARLGWKVGFGAPASLDLMRITAPLLGFLTSRTHLPSGARVDASDWERGLIEFEVAAYVGSDLGRGASDEEARAAVAAIGPAIELANIDEPVAPDNVANIIAGNIFHKGVVLGGRDPARSGLHITGLMATIEIDGAERATTADLETLTGSYPSIVATVAHTLAGAGDALRAGDVIIMGSVIPPVPVGEGTQFTFRLGSFAPISVTIA